MRTFVSRTFEAAGFTLLEILVVIAIVAVLSGAVILGFTGTDETQRLRGVAERIQVRLELARENALQRNREWGVHVDKNAYRFVEFDPMTGKWEEQSQRPFLADGLSSRIEFSVAVDGLEAGALSLDASSAEDMEEGGARKGSLPDILIFSSGEVTPFEWTVSPTWNAAPWVVRNDGLATTELEQQG